MDGSRIVRWLCGWEPADRHTGLDGRLERLELASSRPIDLLGKSARECAAFAGKELRSLSQARLEDEREHGGDPLADGVLGVGCSLDSGPKVLVSSHRLLLEQVEEQSGLPGEVAVKRASREARSSQDVLDSESLIPPLGEHRARGRDEVVELGESTTARHG
ncbi:MAG: hypothetical protein QOC92_3543 [Acidimicrobiaceae bacterium]